jgi:uncharacterized FlaG/YvyC family protein
MTPIIVKKGWIMYEVPKHMKEVIVEFIEEGTDRVIRTCSLEEYISDIESINDTIPKEYKFLKNSYEK